MATGVGYAAAVRIALPVKECRSTRTDRTATEIAVTAPGLPPMPDVIVSITLQTKGFNCPGVTGRRYHIALSQEH